MEQDNEMKASSYLIYAILFVTILILTGITVAYAYFKVETTHSETLSNINVTMDCVDIAYSETGTIDLDYNYPITDTYAMANVKPVTVTVTNNCTANTENVNYTLAITSLSDGTTENYIQDNQIRMNVAKKAGNSSETTLINTTYLSNLTTLTTGNAYTYLNSDLASRPGVTSYTTRKSYVIDTGSIGNGIINTYKIYLWVDYYEGDANAYEGEEHDTTYDNTTENHDFAAAISLVVNP